MKEKEPTCQVAVPLSTANMLRVEVARRASNGRKTTIKALLDDAIVYYLKKDEDK